MQRFLTITYSWARRCAIALVGGTVVLIGIIMIVTPGPALVVIPAGLAILGIEFACARRWLHQLRSSGTKIWGRTRVWLKPKNCNDDSAQNHDMLRGADVQRAIATRPLHPKKNIKQSYYHVP